MSSRKSASPTVQTTRLTRSSLRVKHSWFTEHTVNQIARLSTNLTYVEFPFTNANSGPFNMTVGPDGGLWFVEFTQNKIAAF